MFSWLWNYWYSAALEHIPLTKFLTLYSAVIEHFTCRYSSALVATGRVIVFVTDVDMIPLHERRTFKWLVTSHFTMGGIPENLIVFIEKTCEWNSVELLAQEEKIAEFWAGKTTTRLPTGVTCIKKNCSHYYTNETKNLLYNYLMAMINDQDAPKLDDKL
jgi:hypothetical protein